MVVAVMAATASDNESRVIRREKLSPFTRPVAFGIVEEGIFRSNAFTVDNYAFVQHLKLRSIIYLSSELTRLNDFVEQCSIRFVSRDVYY